MGFWWHLSWGTNLGLFLLVFSFLRGNNEWYGQLYGWLIQYHISTGICDFFNKILMLSCKFTWGWRKWTSLTNFHYYTTCSLWPVPTLKCEFDSLGSFRCQCVLSPSNTRWKISSYIVLISQIIIFYKIAKIVRALWLAERSVCMRVCKHDCGVKLFGFSLITQARIWKSFRFQNST